MKNNFFSLRKFIIFTPHQKNNTMTKKELNAIATKVKKSPASVFTKEDVLAIIEEIKAGTDSKKDKLDANELIDNITFVISGMDFDIISDYSLELDDNCINLDSISLDREAIEEAVKSEVEAWLEE
jgi:Flp pilus assembly CpaE family ATPase